MGKIAIFTLFLGVWVGPCFGSPMDEDKLIKMVKEEMSVLESSYRQYLQSTIIPALQQGAGGDESTPLVIPPIFDPGYTPTPNTPPRIQELLEPVGRSVVYAGLLCRGVGLDQDAEMDEVYVSFASFSRTRNRFLKEFLADQNNPNRALQTELATTTVQCSQFLKKICNEGACNSGKCAYSRALGAGCYHLCEDDHPHGIKTCTNDYYRGQVVPRFALGRASGQHRGPQQNLYGQRPQSFLQQYNQPQQPLMAYGQPSPAYGVQPGYGQQSGAWGSYGQPQNSGGQQGYGQPAPSYGSSWGP